MFEKEAEKYSEAFLYKGVAKASFIKGAEFGYNKGRNEAKEQLGNLLEIIKRPYQFTASRKIQMVKEAEAFLKE